MVSYEGTVKVVDFGVAKAAHRSIETLSGTVKGKVSYMSPEQCKGASEIDRRSDLFSLGIVMWEVLTTEKLFRRNSDFETMQAIVGEVVPPPSQLRPDIPPEIDHVVGRLLAKDPAQRYQNADELHEAIENVAVRTGSALSTASLGRYMRELFGQRPEPWIELAVAEQHPEAFTVTSEPIPNNLAVSAADDFDRKLSAVPALTERLTSPQEGARPPQPTVPLRVAAELVTTLPLGVDPQDLYKTQPIRDSASRIRGVLELQADRQPPAHLPGAMSTNQSGSMPMQPTNQSGSMPMLPSQQNQHPPTLAQTTPMVRAGFTPESGLLRPHSPSGTPHSSPHYPIATGASHQAFTGHAPSYPVAQRANQAARPRRSRALIIIVPAVIIGVVIGIALGFGGSKDKAATSAQGDNSMPPAGTTTMIATVDKPTTPTPTLDRPAAATPTVDDPADQPAAPIDSPVGKPAAPAAKVDNPAGKPAAAKVGNPAAPAAKVDNPAVTAPAAKVEVAADKPTASTAEPAGRVAATRPSVAAPVKQPGVAEPVESTTGNADAPIAMPEDRVAKKVAKVEKPDVERLYRSGKYSEVVATCGSATLVVSLNAPLCTVAACKAKQPAKAKRWFAQVSAAKKSAVIKDCDGVLPAAKDKPPVPADPCKTDPMACQH
jgi:serine/threonine protein kinase